MNYLQSLCKPLHLLSEWQLKPHSCGPTIFVNPTTPWLYYTSPYAKISDFGFRNHFEGRIFKLFLEYISLIIRFIYLSTLKEVNSKKYKNWSRLKYFFPLCKSCAEKSLHLQHIKKTKRKKKPNLYRFIFEKNKIWIVLWNTDIQ